MQSVSSPASSRPAPVTSAHGTARSPNRNGSRSAPHWYSVAFPDKVKGPPFAARLLDERLAIYRTTEGTPVVVRDLRTAAHR
ncbi:MAG: hypothetical protein QM796_21345 [Chthoniobacteraceae bacterium]